MKKALIICAITLLNSCVSSKGIPIKTVEKSIYTEPVNNVLDHSDWDTLLKKHVRDNGLVDYKGFQSDAEELNAYVHYLSIQQPSENWTTQEYLAYFINVYNANTIKLIVDHYPVESIKDVNATISPFLKNFITIKDKSFSLADIEKGILQKMNEPRIHFAINCASYSCPKLLRDAFTAKNVDALMNRAAKAFINSSKNSISQNRVELSEIFKWYKKDFLKNSKTILNYINLYADTKINADASVEYIDYNWNLNDIDN